MEGTHATLPGGSRRHFTHGRPICARAFGATYDLSLGIFRITALSSWVSEWGFCVRRALCVRFEDTRG